MQVTLIAGLVLAAAGVGAQAPATKPARPSPPGLEDLKGLGQLRGAFNRDAGKIRLVLLLSPT